MEHKFKIIQQVYLNEMTPEDAGKILNMRTRVVKQYVTLHGPRLRIIVPLIDKLLEPVNDKHDQTIIKEQLSDLLQVTYRQVTRLVEVSGVKIPRPLATVGREKHSLNAKSRTFMRKRTALEVIAGKYTAEYAAKAAQVSEKHIYRLANELLNIEGLVFRDLRKMTDTTKQQLATRLATGVSIV